MSCRRGYVLFVVLTLTILSLFLLRGLPEHMLESRIQYTAFGVEETGATNQVTAILFDYRSLDTLGEASVIFATAAILFVFAPKKRSSMMDVRLSVLVHHGVSLILPFMLLFGLYIIVFGHISPGGGFTGGVMLSSAVIVYSLTYSAGGERPLLIGTEKKKVVENAGMLLFLVVGMVGLILGGYFLANAPAGMGLGRPGTLNSGGFIPLLNLASGLKVGAGMAIIFVNLAREM